jgi:hypothetical protein
MDLREGLEQIAAGAPHALTPERWERVQSSGRRRVRARWAVAMTATVAVAAATVGVANAVLGDDGDRDRLATGTGQQATLAIPKLGVTAAVVWDGSPLTGHDVHAVPASAPPCGDGPAVLDGPRTTYGQTFWSLDQLAVGDSVTITTDHLRCTYAVAKVETRRTTPEDVLTSVSGDGLALVTTTPRFTRDALLIVYLTRGRGSQSTLPGARVSGVLRMTGGPAGAAAQPVPGTVVFMDDRGNRYSASAQNDGRFTAQLPTGQYFVTATSPLYNSGATTCTYGPLTVTGQRVAEVAVNCPRK